MLFEEEHNACEYVLSFGSRVEVLEPQSLRQLVWREAQAIAALYTRTCCDPDRAASSKDSP